MIALWVLAGCSEDIKPPVAIIAGPTTAHVGAIVELDGSESYDPAGGRVSFDWAFLHLPPRSLASFNSFTIENPAFIADVAGTYTAVLVVTSRGLPSSATLFDIEVSPCGGLRPIVASITADMDNPGVGDTITLLAEAEEPDNAEACGMTQTLSYHWTLIARPATSRAELGNPALPGTSIQLDMAGYYAFELVVTDSTGLASEPAELGLTAGECGGHNPEVVSIATSPADPMAGDPVRLSASVFDPDNETACNRGQTFDYLWELVELPNGSQAQLAGETLAESSLATDLAGAYEVQLTLTDSTGRSSLPLSTTVTVNSCGINAPTIDDLAVPPVTPNTGDQVVIELAVSDPDNGSACNLDQDLSVASELIDRPAGSMAEVTPAEGLHPAFVADMPGEYAIRVTVSDETGRSSSEDITVTVSECGSHPPVATLTAQPSQPVEGQRVVLTATVIDSDLWDGSPDDTCRLSDSFRYEWEILSAPVGSLASILLPGSPHSGFVPDLAGTYAIECRVFDSAGHRNVVEGPDGNLTVTVVVAEDASPEVSAGAVPDGGLSPLTVQLTCLSSEGEPPFSYSWSLGNGVTAFEQNPVFTYTQGGVYVATCTVTDGNGDVGLGTVTVDVRQDTAPQVVISADPASGQEPLEVQFASACTGGDDALGFRWDYGDGAVGTGVLGTTEGIDRPRHNFATSGTYLVTLTITDQDGDVGSASLEVAVAADTSPVVTHAIAAPTGGVSPLAVHFAAAGAGGEPPLVYTWDFGDGTTSNEQNPTHTFVVANPSMTQTFTATVTARDADGDVAVKTVQVTVQGDMTPVATIGLPADDPHTVTAGDAVAFECSGQTTGNGSSTGAWEFGDGQFWSGFSAVHTYFTPGSYQAVCTATDEDGDTATDSIAIVVNSRVPSLTASSLPATNLEAPGVSPLTVHFYAIGSGGDSPLSYYWTFGDGTSSELQNPLHSYQNLDPLDDPRHYNARATVTDNDGDTWFVDVDVFVAYDSRPMVAATPEAATGAASLDVAFDCQMTGGNAPIEAIWDFGDGFTSTVMGTSHSYSAPGFYLATCQAADTDGDTAMATVPVRVQDGGELVVAIETDPAVPVGPCPLKVEYSALVSQGVPPYTYLWELDGVEVSTKAVFVATYTIPTDFTVSLTVTDAGGATGTATVVASAIYNTAPSVIITAYREGSYTPLLVQFNSSVERGNGVLSYHWDFGDGSTLDGTVPPGGPDIERPSHLYEAVDPPVILIASLTVTDEDGDISRGTATFNFQNRPPVAWISPEWTVFAELGSQVFLTGENSWDPDYQPLGYEWGLWMRPDGSSTEIPDRSAVTIAITPDVIGEYRVGLNVTDGHLWSTVGPTVIMAGAPVMAGGGEFTSGPGSLIGLMPWLYFSYADYPNPTNYFTVPGKTIVWEASGSVTLEQAQTTTDEYGGTSNTAIFGLPGMGTVTATYTSAQGLPVSTTYNVTVLCFSDTDCEETTGGACDVGTGICLLPPCENGVKDPGETDIDCGGENECQRCRFGDECLVDEDCFGSDCDPETLRCIGRWHVNIAQATSGNGLSWPEAFKTLQEALDIAEPGEEIWVAGGIYQPGGTVESTFRINGEHLYGGFVGTEIDLDERPVEPANPTILSGWIPASPENVYHVVTVEGDGVVFDGFQVTRGDADFLWSTEFHGRGGGMLAVGVDDLVVRNSVFQGNSGRGGGGIYGNDLVNPTIDDCDFLDNTSDGETDGRIGGGMCLENSTGVLVLDSVFDGNQSVHTGGGLALNNVTGMVSGTTIKNNSGVFRGGGAWVQGDSTMVTIVNSVFANNTVPESYYVQGAGLSMYSGSVDIINCTFYGNNSPVQDDVDVNAQYTDLLFINNIVGLTVLPAGSMHYNLLLEDCHEYCDINEHCWLPGSFCYSPPEGQDYCVLPCTGDTDCEAHGAVCGGNGYCEVSIEVSGETVVYPLSSMECGEPEFLNYSPLDLHFLDADSPGIDAGIVSYGDVRYCPGTDLDGNSRPQPAWGTCDMGAYEFPNDSSYPYPENPSVFINEINYLDMWGDPSEGFELAGVENTDLTGWSVYFYDGPDSGELNGYYYDHLDLTGILFGGATLGYGFNWYSLSLADTGGIALVGPSGMVVQFLSYGYLITAMNGPADGLTSELIGVVDNIALFFPPGDPFPSSIGLAGYGRGYYDFTWDRPVGYTMNWINADQSFME